MEYHRQKYFSDHHCMIRLSFLSHLKFASYLLTVRAIRPYPYNNSKQGENQQNINKIKQEGKPAYFIIRTQDTILHIRAGQSFLKILTAATFDMARQENVPSL
jgi:hypothetical protein